jgi:hypothetical protein
MSYVDERMANSYFSIDHLPDTFNQDECKNIINLFHELEDECREYEKHEVVIDKSKNILYALFHSTLIQESNEVHNRLTERRNSIYDKLYETYGIGYDEKWRILRSDCNSLAAKIAYENSSNKMLGVFFHYDKDGNLSEASCTRKRFSST